MEPVAVDQGPLWSDRCAWSELLDPVCLDAGRVRLDLPPGWASRWSASWRAGNAEVVCPVRDLSDTAGGAAPVRRFSWSTRQRHRPGLFYMVSTGRHHGFESLAESRLLLVLDFAGRVGEVASQPFELRFCADGGSVRHTPDFLARTAEGTWLIDVRPAERIGVDDLVAFAASAEVALACGWRYLVASRWLPSAVSAVDGFSAQRRPLTDRFGLRRVLLERAAEGGWSFGALADACEVPPVARAWLLHLLWHRRLGMDLRGPLGDHTVVRLADGGRP